MMYKHHFCTGGIFMLSGGEKTKTLSARRFIRGIITGAVAALIMLAAVSALISAGKLGWAYANDAVIAVNFIAAAAAGYASGRKGRGALVCGLASGAAVMAILLLLGASLGGGTISGTEAGRIVLCSLGGSALGAALATMTGNKKLHKKFASKR
jgi:putative membrane protein (TIGR04086 family)